MAVNYYGWCGIGAIIDLEDMVDGGVSWVNEAVAKDLFLTWLLKTHKEKVVSHDWTLWRRNGEECQLLMVVHASPWTGVTTVWEG
jgi:hypothetical protein